MRQFERRIRQMHAIKGEKMSKQVTLRNIEKRDYANLEKIICNTWNFNRFSSNKTALKLSRLYLSSCLTNQTFVKVADVEGKAVGVIMGKDIKNHKTPLKYRLHFIKSAIKLLILKEGRQTAKIFMSIEEIYKRLLGNSDTEYQGEVAFFAVDESYRGLGIGKKLYDSLVEYMKERRIGKYYLYTDTQCNYGFYVSRGMVRRSEHQQFFDIIGEKMELTFYLYDKATV